MKKTKAGKALISVVDSLHGHPGIEELKVKKNQPKTSKSALTKNMVYKDKVFGRQNEAKS
jgi:hypothetical protein